MNYSFEDYMIAVLAGKCDEKLPKGIGYEIKPISYQRWAAREKMRQDLRDQLADKLIRKD